MLRGENSSKARGPKSTTPRPEFRPRWSSLVFRFLIFALFACRTLLTMRRVLLCTGFLIIFAPSLIADSNLRITDVGLHGYSGTTPCRK